MSNSPVAGYAPILLAASETVFGVADVPANPAAYAALALATIEAKMGPAGQAPNVRPKADRGQGRGMQDGYVSGRFDPVPFSVVTSFKTRASVNSYPREAALFAATGLQGAVGAGFTYDPIAPAETTPGAFQSCTLTRLLGRTPAQMEMERLTGCIVQSLRIEGGDKEVMLTFSGVGSKKDVGGGLDSATVATTVATTVTITADESYQLAAGYYVWESEVVLVTAPTPGATSVTIARGQLGTTAATHTAKPLVPYIPPSISYAGAPISEAASTVTFDGVAFRVLNWSFEFQTGIEPLPGETGSAYFQGLKVIRYQATCNLTFILKGDDVRKFNKAAARKEVAVAISQGTGVGGQFAISIPQCELVAAPADDNANDSITVSASLRLRDVAAGGGMFQLQFQ